MRGGTKRPETLGRCDYKLRSDAQRSQSVKQKGTAKGACDKRDDYDQNLVPSGSRPFAIRNMAMVAVKLEN